MNRLRFAALVFVLFGFSTAAYASESTSTPKMVTCKDGTKSEAGQGACSHHGGVKPHKTVTCTDGTKSAAGQGACSHHGGVKSVAQKPPAASGAKSTASGSKPAASGSLTPHANAPGSDTPEPQGPNED